MYGADMLAEPAATAFDLGQFRLETLITTGGMGAIWRGVHRSEQTPVAIKVMVADELRRQADYFIELQDIQSDITRLADKDEEEPGDGLLPTPETHLETA